MNGAQQKIIWGSHCDNACVSDSVTAGKWWYMRQYYAQGVAVVLKMKVWLAAKSEWM